MSNDPDIANPPGASTRPPAGSCTGRSPRRHPPGASERYAALDELVRGLLARLQQEPDLLARTALVAAMARAEWHLALLHRALFPSDPTTAEQATAIADSARLLAAVTIAGRGACGARVALPVWTHPPWSSGAPALRMLATATEPARRARALELLAAALHPHLGRTATECLLDLAAVEELHAHPAPEAVCPRCGPAR